jgi:hypothetical protein
VRAPCCHLLRRLLRPGLRLSLKTCHRVGHPLQHLLLATSSCLILLPPPLSRLRVQFSRQVPPPPPFRLAKSSTSWYIHSVCCYCFDVISFIFFQIRRKFRKYWHGRYERLRKIELGIRRQRHRSIGVLLPSGTHRIFDLPTMVQKHFRQD